MAGQVHMAGGDSQIAVADLGALRLLARGIHTQIAHVYIGGIELHLPAVALDHRRIDRERT